MRLFMQSKNMDLAVCAVVQKRSNNRVWTADDHALLVKPRVSSALSAYVHIKCVPSIGHKLV
jgi:hypothetical protein